MSLYSSEIEPQMEAINYFINAGCQIISAHLIDREGRRTDLPVEAFDGVPIADHMRKLLEEYHQALQSGEDLLDRI